ncbi:hypothetical protein ACFWZ4_13330 [Frateuria sp. GZRe12]|uniref:hypothetical protein n=1 Tax=Frateuria sp. GZRe12 TaxID=3351533 RepID=UPI003EDC371C
MNSASRPSKPFTDPLTASVVGGVLLLIAAAGVLLGANALATGCVRLLRGRHGPGILHCAPEPSYWIATMLSLALGTAVAVGGLKFLRIARSARNANAARR